MTPTISSISPSSGLKLGGTVVVLNATQPLFNNQLNISCEFSEFAPETGVFTVQATILSPTSVECITPVLLSLPGSPILQLRVKLEFNGILASSVPVNFTFIGLKKKNFF